eukprot:TRINITY_DN58230_c0_g1_i1.p1 TRINITY_DN58230_c0_g1~~TRINITY_DN58230_c0_g1_i1.p1  ORF type:complete len:214 (+),score=29.84 TRINITY_DN58230_c0_g1_i1:76-717(+)
MPQTILCEPMNTVWKECSMKEKSTRAEASKKSPEFWKMVDSQLAGTWNFHGASRTKLPSLKNQESYIAPIAGYCGHKPDFWVRSACQDLQTPLEPPSMDALLKDLQNISPEAAPASARPATSTAASSRWHETASRHSMSGRSRRSRMSRVSSAPDGLRPSSMPGGTLQLGELLELERAESRHSRSSRHRSHRKRSSASGRSQPGSNVGDYLVF